MDVNKQTALKHFLMGIYDLKIIKLDDNDKINQLSDLYHDALKMQKEQIEKAFRDGFFDGCNPLIFKIDDEQYYKEKYESKTNI
jgi:hypothetical protein